MSKNRVGKVRDYIIKVLNGMALGLFSSLIIGLILKQIGSILQVDILMEFGSSAQLLMSPAIGAGVAYSLGAPALVIFSAIIAGALGGGAVSLMVGQAASLSIGEPVGAFISALIGSELGRRVSGKTSIDIILVPALVIIVGGLVGHYLAPPISGMMNKIGDIINFATKQQPLIMGVIVSVIMGIALTMPISSAAIGISLQLSGLAAGAAVVGGASHMISFAVNSYEDNGFGGLISQGLGTSMLQISNIIRKPIIILPAIITSAILGPVSTMVFKLESNPIGSGMGTSGLVGQFSTLEVMGQGSIYSIVILHFLLPALISWLITKFLRKKKLIEKGDMKLTS